jgi:hypothetical protein
MSARAMMRMRALLLRDVNMAHDAEDKGLERDKFNQRAPPDWKIMNDALPCYAWAGPMGGRHAVTSGVMVMVVDMPGMIVPKSADIIPGDRIEEVKDRIGTVILKRMQVDSVFPRSTHKEARLRSYADVEG